LIKPKVDEANMHTYVLSNPSLASSITLAASKQTYYTIRFLVDKNLVDDAFRAYAYFRWLDDHLDQQALTRVERLEFVKRQQTLMDAGYRGDSLPNLTSEEHMLLDLIQRDIENNSGLHAYIRNMMAVMVFDAERRGQLITQRELNEYTAWLATAVTEALHYFIGHGCASPHSEIRYQAVTGAHITHMVRDALEDAEAGYYNIPREVMASYGIDPWDVKSRAYRNWVKERVQKARACFQVGRGYLSQVENLRCRIAGYAYIRRFEVVLDCIEREGCLLRAIYTERKSSGRGVEMIGWAIWMALNHHKPASASSS
jgi:phytoene/squalene synthetase